MDISTQITTSTEEINQREYRLAKNIYELYSFTWAECQEYLAKLEAKGVNKSTREVIRKEIFRIPA